MNNFAQFLKRTPLMSGGAGMVMAVVLLIVVGSLIKTVPAAEVSRDTLFRPSRQHLLGTDWLGRDVLSRIIVGGRVSLMVAVMAATIGVSVGTALGLVAGLGPNWIDEIIMRCMDILLSFPYILLAIVVVAFLGPSLLNAMIAIGLTQVPLFARLVRSSVLTIKEIEFIEAAKAVGASFIRIAVRHILPNLAGTIIVQATISLAYAILAEATLGFLGLGAQPPIPSWGSMLSEARTYMSVAPWVAWFPGLAILLTVMGFNLLGDSLRDYIDPRLKYQRKRA